MSEGPAVLWVSVGESGQRLFVYIKPREGMASAVERLFLDPDLSDTLGNGTEPYGA